MDNKKLWYACMLDNDDNDWGFGSYDLDVARNIVCGWIHERKLEAHILVIEQSEHDAVCIGRIEGRA